MCWRSRARDGSGGGRALLGRGGQTEHTGQLQPEWISGPDRDRDPLLIDRLLEGAELGCRQKERRARWDLQAHLPAAATGDADAAKHIGESVGWCDDDR